MGTDIHMCMEVRIDDTWKKCINCFRDTRFDIGNVGKDQYDQRLYTSRLDIDRNYHLFAILADVRNGTGFAGCKTTAKQFNCISKPRGYPDDMAWEREDDFPHKHHVLSFQHTPSWLTLEEIEKFDWDQTYTEYGCITLKQYKKMIETNTNPDTWASDVGGYSFTKIGQKKANALIEYNAGLETPDTWDKIYVMTEFIKPETYRDVCSQFLGFIKHQVRPLLSRSNGQVIPDEDVRLVFDFDS